jgi:Fe-S oxidoreductase
VEGDGSLLQRARASLQEVLHRVSEKCTNCEICQKECLFLRKYGKPKEIAEAYDPSDKAFQAMPFECSLCQLCAAVCPEKINPAKMFLEMRRENIRQTKTGYPGHAGMLAYERRGTSRRYSYYAIPAGCDTVFFPGCNRPGSRPDKTYKLYEHMTKGIPTLGIVLDCCMGISHDLGRMDPFIAMFQEMKHFLVENGVRNVLVACPSCYRIFKEYGEDLAVKTVYEVVAENGLHKVERANGVVTIHDPCALRFEESAHSAVRHLVTTRGLTVEEMPHHGDKTLCCGEGGFAGCLSPGLAKNWGSTRKREAKGRRIITYCAGCANLLNRMTPTSHILDLLFGPAAALSGRTKGSRAPVTYINRLKLKNRLKKMMDARVTRERTFTTVEGARKGGSCWD